MTVRGLSRAQIIVVDKLPDPLARRLVAGDVPADRGDSRAPSACWVTATTGVVKPARAGCVVDFLLSPRGGCSIGRWILPGAVGAGEDAAERGRDR